MTYCNGVVPGRYEHTPEMHLFAMTPAQQALYIIIHYASAGVNADHSPGL